MFGQTADKIEEAYLNECKKKGAQPIVIRRADSLEEAVRISSNKARNGDVVILSPASASFDMFKNFEDRGNKFKEYVKKL